MQAVEFVPKDKRIKYKKVDYNATSEETVTPIFREAFIENKLIVFPIEQTVEKLNGVTQINAKYKIVDIETGEYEILASSGQGADSQDKGAGKAMTYSFKYLFFKTFFTPTGDDPDKIASKELDDKNKNKKNNKSWQVDNFRYTEADVKNMMMRKYNGDKEKAMEDWDMFKDMDNQAQIEIIKDLREKVKA